jgi:hypothetical protein
LAATAKNGSYLQAHYRRLRLRVGHGRALGAVKHSMLCACWHMLSSGELYHDLGGDCFPRLDPERQRGALCGSWGRWVTRSSSRKRRLERELFSRQ